MRLIACCAAMLSLAGCVNQPQLVMLNPQTGVMVGCQLPELNGGSGAYLATRECLSACQAHGFRPVPGATAHGSDGVPQVCLN